MKELTIPAYAKINLTLDVLGKRPDGYHDLSMVMQSVSLADQVIIRETGEEGFTLKTDLGFLPGADKNIAGVAARAFARHTGVDLSGLEIELQKHIPVCAGTAGGSSDGAAVLRGLNRWFSCGLSLRHLAEIGEEVGSDVPYCVLGCTALAEGRGEKLTCLPALPDCHIVLCKPGFSVSTPELFRRIDELKLRFHPDTAGVLAALEEGISFPAAWRQGFAALSGEGGRILRRLEPEGDEQRILGELTWAAGELTELRRGLEQESRQREKLWFAGLFSGAGLLLILLI